MPQGRPLSRLHALARIRELAKVGAIRVARNAQKGIDRLGYDVEDAVSILEECELEECVKDEPANFGDGCHVYVFIVELEDECALYIKVSLNIHTLESAELLSFKLDGSPE